MPTRISSSSLFLTGPTWSTAASVFLVQSLRSRAPNGPDKQVVTNFFALMTRLLHLDLLSWRFNTVSGPGSTIEFQTWKATTCVEYMEFSTWTVAGVTGRTWRPWGMSCTTVGLTTEVRYIAGRLQWVSGGSASLTFPVDISRRPTRTELSGSFSTQKSTSIKNSAL